MKIGKGKSRALTTRTNLSAMDKVYSSVAVILETARADAYRAVNQVMVQAYWEIGRVIVEEEQKGKKRAGYGEALIMELAQRLTENYGKGFTKTNLFYMRQFYLTFPKFHALRGELPDSVTHRVTNPQCGTHCVPH